MTQSPRLPNPKKSNSPFAWHGIDHLSVSSINQWISSPASYLYKIAGGFDSYGPAAWRGSSLEVAFEKALFDKVAPNNMFVDVANYEFDDRNELEFDPVKVEKERKTLPEYIDAGIEHFRNLPNCTSYQRKISVDFDELEIPFIGYVDFEFGTIDNNHQIRDCKTSGKRISEMTNAHARQLALYGHAIGNENTELWIDLVTRKETICMRLKNPKPHLEIIKKSALGLRKFLSLSNDTKELCQILMPDFDDWRWSNNKINEAKKMWEI
jgi:hypothetical protein